MSNVIFTRLRETTLATDAEPTEPPITCGICLSEDWKEQDLEHRVNSASSHRFHKECLERWLNVQQICPLCSGRVTYVDGKLLTMPILLGYLRYLSLLLPLLVFGIGAALIQNNYPSSAQVPAIRPAPTYLGLSTETLDLAMQTPAFSEARDTMVVWNRIRTDSGDEPWQNFTSGDAVIEESYKFYSWLKHNEVWYLSLNNLNLTSFPRAIFALSNLRALNLYRNQLKNLPKDIGRLSHLEVLGLGDNQLTELPVSLFGLTRLTYLGLSGNRLKEIPDFIKRMSQLRRLFISDNPLSSFPPVVLKLSELEELGLAGLQIATLPTELGALKKLGSIHVTDTLVPELSRTFESRPGLKITGSTPQRFWPLED